MTTPFERELLTWYYCRVGMFQRERGKPSSLVTELETKFIKAGLLRYDIVNDEIRGNQAALAVYMEALSAVPLPVMRWITPA